MEGAQGRRGGPSVALLGRGGALPLAGHFFGRFDGPCSLAWAGRVTSGAQPELAWRAARAIQGALVRKGTVDADRRRALSVMWARLDAVSREALGPNGGDDLVLLMAAADEEGVALSGVGVEQVLGCEAGGTVLSWIEAPHPLLGLAGLPARRPGAVLIEIAPDWVIGVPQGGAEAAVGGAAATILARCGVHR